MGFLSVLLHAYDFFDNGFPKGFVFTKSRAGLGPSTYEAGPKMGPLIFFCNVPDRILFLPFDDH